MKKWCTEIYALCPVTNDMKVFQGIAVDAISPRLAQEWCLENGFGYCRVTGEELVGIIEEDGSEIKFNDFQEN